MYIDEDDTSHLFRNTDGTIAIILSDQATCVPGICESEFQIIESNTIVTSRKFNIIVKKSVVDGKTIESAIESNVINKMIKHLIDYANPHKVTKAQVGLANVENKSSATIRGELTKSNVTTALGYTPLNQKMTKLQLIQKLLHLKIYRVAKNYLLHLVKSKRQSAL